MALSAGSSKLTWTNLRAYYQNGEHGNNPYQQEGGYYDGQQAGGYQDDYYQDQYYDQGAPAAGQQPHYAHGGYGYVLTSDRRV